MIIILNTRPLTRRARQITGGALGFARRMATAARHPRKTCDDWRQDRANLDQAEKHYRNRRVRGD